MVRKKVCFPDVYIGVPKTQHYMFLFLTPHYYSSFAAGKFSLLLPSIPCIMRHPSSVWEQ